MHKNIKPVFSRRSHFTIKGLFKIIFIILIHILSILAFFAVIESINYFQFNDQWIFQGYKLWLLLYLLLIGPILTSIAHIIYLDTGNLSLKTFVWLHTWAIIIVILVIISL